MQSRVLPDGRLHLHHGPIDLIINIWGSGAGTGAGAAYAAANARFSTILDELVGELPLLRTQVSPAQPVGRIAQRMVGAVQPHSEVFVTPMAAIAGAVADEVCAVISAVPGVMKAYVNNGGDIAVFLRDGENLRAALYDDGDAARVEFRHDWPGRGLATSGWRGRSHSLGIADAVTVLGECAAQADVAATLIANAVDLPGHPEIRRLPANTLAADSDLGTRPVTVDVGAINPADAKAALNAGLQVAEIMLANDLILGAVIFLQGAVVQTGNMRGLVADDT